ncbi:MAG: glycosyltransferase family 4 protein [Chloroflexi bacterium]|nr:glycosyltransferase family 4 protein [Chloroflexota bacterium]
MTKDNKNSRNRVIIASTNGRLSGVDIFSVNLVRGLLRLGIPAHVLLTKHYQVPRDPLRFPSDIPVRKLPVNQENSWPARWQTLIGYLEEHAPCIYIPNYDWDHSCVSPALSERVGIVGVVHSDDPKHYDHVSRLGRYWNAIVAVSDAIAHRINQLDTDLPGRLVTIPNGVEIPPKMIRRDSNDVDPLRVIYAGRLVQYQKRIFDLVKIVKLSANEGIPIELTVIGGGSAQKKFRTALSAYIDQKSVKLLGILPNQKVLDKFAESEVFIMTSDFEGLPMGLLEAMGRGCVPVVTDIRSGIPELVQDGVNGYRVSVGDIEAFVDRLDKLQRNQNLREDLGLKAYQTIRDGGYRVEDMAQKYSTLFENVWKNIDDGSYRRPHGIITTPPSLAWRAHMPTAVRRIYRVAKRLLYS